MMGEWQNSHRFEKVIVKSRPPLSAGRVVLPSCSLPDALLCAGEAAFDEWIEHLPVDETHGLDISPELISVFHSLITRAMKTLDQGFSALPLTSTSTLKDI